MTLREFVDSVPELSKQTWTTTFCGTSSCKGADTKAVWAAIEKIHGKPRLKQDGGHDRYFGNILVQTDRTQSGYLQISDLS